LIAENRPVSSSVLPVSNGGLVVSGSGYRNIQIQKSDENVSNSQIYRRCPVHVLKGMPDEDARKFLSCVEEDFNIVLSDVIKSKLLQRIHNSKRGGLGVAIDILFRAMRVEVPGMTDFYLALVDDAKRSDALKLIQHKETIHNSEDAIMGAMTIQR